MYDLVHVLELDIPINLLGGSFVREIFLAKNPQVDNFSYVDV